MESIRRPGPSSGRAARRALSAWLPVALWVAVIWTLGTVPFAASETSRLLSPLVHALFPDLTLEGLAAANRAIRVLAHLTEYAVLALLAVRAFRSSLDRPWVPLAGSLALVLGVALADEARQATHPERTGAATDVALDFAGGVTALAVANAVRRMRG